MATNAIQRIVARAARALMPLAGGEAPIVPKSTISGRALVAVVAIMTFLASLTTGSVMLVRASAQEWQADVAREVTIQIRPAAGRDIEADVRDAIASILDTMTLEQFVAVPGAAAIIDEEELEKRAG